MSRPIGYKLSDETKKKISLGNKGKRISLETRKKLADKQRKYHENHKNYWYGKKRSVESRDKMSLSKKKYYLNGGINHNKGNHLSEETKRKISNSKKIYFAKGGISANWKGGIKYRKDNYVEIYCPSHPNANKNYVLEHRLVMEKHLGRILLSTEIVHHINGIRNDNRIENLMLFSSVGKHIKYHKILKGT